MHLPCLPPTLPQHPQAPSTHLHLPQGLVIILCQLLLLQQARQLLLVQRRVEGNRSVCIKANPLNKLPEHLGLALGGCQAARGDLVAQQAPAGGRGGVGGGGIGARGWLQKV